MFSPLKVMLLLGSCPVRKLGKHFLWSDGSEDVGLVSGPEDVVTLANVGLQGVQA